MLSSLFLFSAFWHITTKSFLASTRDVDRLFDLLLVVDDHLPAASISLQQEQKRRKGGTVATIVQCILNVWSNCLLNGRVHLHYLLTEVHDESGQKRIN